MNLVQLSYLHSQMIMTYGAPMFVGGVTGPRSEPTLHGIIED